MENRVLANVEPKNVLRFFEEMCAIPHGSGNTKAVSDWAVQFAKDRSLRYRQDELGNVVIWKDATPGYEDHPTVMLQGHLDMVCVSDTDVVHDFEKDGLSCVWRMASSRPPAPPSAAITVSLSPWLWLCWMTIPCPILPLRL